MTSAGGPGSIGEAFIDVHANTTPFHRELPRQLDDAADRAEGELGKTGEKMGDDISDGVDKVLKRRGRGFARSISEGTKNTIIRVRSIFRFDQIRDAFRRRFRRDVGDTISEEIGDALDRAGRPGGPISKLSQAVADAVGAGFNISGRSPLIAVLIPALLALVGVIVAALQAVNALVAVLFIIPSLLGAIALQVGVVAIAFQGVGEATQKAFAAKNAKELNEALKGLTPSAQSFVRSLLPLREFFRELRDYAQERFFNQLGGVIRNLQRALGPTLIAGFGDLAEKAGRFLRQFTEVLSSPQFVAFIRGLFAATSDWIKAFGSSLFGDRGFLQGLIAMGTTLMPFMERFGKIVLFALDRLGYLMFRVAEGGDTAGWLDRMADTLQLVIDLLFNVGDFLYVFLRGLDEAGGAEVIEILSAALQELMFFLTSPVGQKAMEALVDLAKFGIASFTGLVIAILAVMAAFEVLGEWLRRTFIPTVVEAIRVFLQGIVNAATFLGVWIERIVLAIGRFFNDVGRGAKVRAQEIVGTILGIIRVIQQWIDRIRGIPGQAKAAFAGAGSFLYNAGRALIQGLIDGIRAKIQPLLDLLNWISSRVGGFFGNSPAIYGALAGRGWTKYRGQNLMQGLIEGIREEIPTLRQVTSEATSNIVFGRDSVQVNMTGEVSQSQARTVGSAVGMSAANMIAARNTRLAVRTL